MNSAIQFRTILLLILVAYTLDCFALLPKAQAATETALSGFNTVDGDHALFSITTGVANTAIGWFSLRSNTDGSFNTALGAGTLLFNVGNQSTMEGVENTGIGAGALLSNSIGAQNTASGAFALFSNTEGNGNTAAGDRALFSNTTGAANTADGFFALLGNTEGNGNTAIGDVALANNTTGSFNVAVGVGAGAGVETASNVICIGHAGANLSNRCFIGNIFGAFVSGNAVPVLIDPTGQLGTTVSSRRFKKEIQPMGKASEAILELQPVRFHYKSDPARAGPQFGLVAEDVAQVNADLVVRARMVRSGLSATTR